jgi:hypothetical protein
LLTPLVADRNRIMVAPLGAGQNFTLGVIPKNVAPADVAFPDTVRVPTKVEGVFLNYHEVWAPERTSDDYILNRSYMHVHLKRKQDSPDLQLLCLHCEPSLKQEKGDASFPYKRGPHLHIGGASPDIARAHIAICLNDSDFGGSDIDLLTKTLRAAVQMIRQEIFPRYGGN